jgi:hypothetical protein
MLGDSGNIAAYALGAGEAVGAVLACLDGERRQNLQKYENLRRRLSQESNKIRQSGNAAQGSKRWT